ncbi:MAG: hypothetical protein H7831_14575 [Magnetococcus sp. WYHC-3]
MRLAATARTWNILGLLLFASMSTAIFWEVLPWFFAPLAPDAPPFFPFGNRTVTLENLLVAGGEFTPQHLYWFVFHPLLANKLIYILDALMLVLAGVYYLRGRGSSHAAAWIGGVALGFSGYTFTLFSAGHRGYFHMMACTVFAFGLLLRCFQGRRWFHFAMLGACVAWSVPYQADVLVFVVLLAAAYALWLTFARCADPATPPLQRIVRVWPRFLLSLVVAGLIAAPGIRVVIGEQITGRKAQITSTSTVDASATTPEAAAQKKREKWIFATNWSLPPADMAEFIVPGIFGNDSFQPPYPYWGALGRPYGWEPGQRMMPNYRQHTVYLGVLPVCFAFFAVLLWWRTRRGSGVGMVEQEGQTGGLSAVARAKAGPALPVRDDPLVDVPFWIGAGVICLLLALGRYTPFYRLFYALPYMDLVRCPVKFHHLVEICTAMLCGLGVEMWWRGEVAVVGRRLTILAMAMAGVLLFAAGMVAMSDVAIAAHIATLGGLGEYGKTLAGYTVENLVRAAFLFGVVALLFWLGRLSVGRTRLSAGLLAILALVLAVDLVTVARRFVRPINMQPFYASHVVSDMALARGGIGVRVANYATGNEPTRDWFACSLWSRGVGLTLAPPAPGSTEAAVLQALANRPDMLWRATHTRFVIAPWKVAAPMVKGQVLEPLVSFALGQGTVRQVPPAADACVLAAIGSAMPATYLVDGWQGGLSATVQVQRMSMADWDPARATVCDVGVGTNQESHLIGAARVVQRRGADFCLNTIIAVDTPLAGLLVSDEKYADDLVALVDGREAPVCRANALWAAVEVPAGRHEVMLRRHLHVWPVLLSGCAGLAIGIWALLRLIRGWRRKD